MGFIVSGGKPKSDVFGGQLDETLPPALALHWEINTLERRAEYPVRADHHKGKSSTKPSDKLACPAVVRIPGTRV